MVTQAVRSRKHGRARIRFYMIGRLDDTPTVQNRTRTGNLTVSTPEATALDLVTRPASPVVSTTLPPS